MNSTRHIYAIAGLITVLSALSLSSTHLRGAAAAPSNPQPVVVVNGSANPVQTAVTSLPAVQLSGTPNVNVSSLPAVQLAAGTGVAINGIPENGLPVNVAS